MQIRTLIASADDSLETLRDYIHKFCPNLEVISESSVLDQSVGLIITYKPELLILDSALPGGGGFELLRQIRPEGMQVIMISDNPDHAVEAFRFQVTDYLINPVKPDELKEAVNKVVKVIGSRDIMTEPEVGSTSRNAWKVTDKQLVIPNSKGFVVVKTDEIILCEASGYCTNFYLTGKAKLSSSRNLKFYESLLPGGQFIRVHNSYIVNREHVKGYSFQGDIQLSENLKCSLSAGHKQEFLSTFKKQL